MKVAVYSSPDGENDWTRTLFLEGSDDSVLPTLAHYRSRPGANLRAYRLDTAEGSFGEGPDALAFADATASRVPTYAEVDAALEPLAT